MDQNILLMILWQSFMKLKVSEWWGSRSDMFCFHTTVSTARIWRIFCVSRDLRAFPYRLQSSKRCSCFALPSVASHSVLPSIVIIPARRYRRTRSCYCQSLFDFRLILMNFVFAMLVSSMPVRANSTRLLIYFTRRRVYVIRDKCHPPIPGPHATWGCIRCVIITSSRL